MECCLLWNFYSLNQVRIQISQRRITPTLPLPATTNNYYFKKKHVNWVYQNEQFVSFYLSLILSLSLRVCLSFGCFFQLSLWLQTSLILELFQFPVSMTLLFSLLSIRQFTIFLVTFILGCLHVISSVSPIYNFLSQSLLLSQPILTSDTYVGSWAPNLSQFGIKTR